MTFLSKGTRIVFVLPGFSPIKANQGIFSVFHRTGVVKQADSRVVHLTLDVPLSADDIAQYTDLATYLPHGQAVDVVILPCSHVLGIYPFDKNTPLQEAYQQGGPFRLPLPFTMHAKLSLALHPDSNHHSIATVVAVHHHFGCYDVSCTDPVLTYNRPPSILAIPGRNVYRVPANSVAFGCNPVDAATGQMPDIRTQLRSGVWRQLQCFKVNNVLKRPYSTHKDGNKTSNLAGYNQLKASHESDSDTVELAVVYDPYEPGVGFADPNETDTPPERDDALALWRYYCGFTESVSGNPVVAIPAEESHDSQARTEPRGHYFDTRNYAEIDFAHGTLELTPRYQRQGYPIPKSGDWVCGIVGRNHMGSCLTLWFVCSGELKQLIDYVQQPTLSLNSLSGSFRTNRYLDNLQARLEQAKMSEAKQAWVAEFNTAVNREAVRSETTSRPMNRDVYATVLHLLVEESNNFEPLDAYALDVLADVGIVDPHVSVMNTVHDIDPFRILVYYHWWQKHDKPERPKANPNRLQRFLDDGITQT